MSVNQLRPYERHMVSNISALLAAGQPLSSLGVGQLGIFDAKTNLSVTAPTYQTNRRIYFAQGTPDKSAFPEGAGVPNMYRKTHVIDGKKVKRLYGKSASQGRGEVVTLGYDGADLTKTLTAKPGDTFYYYVRLTGEPIFNLNPDRNKGVIIEGAVQMPCPDDCSDNCTTVDCQTIVNGVINDWNGILDPETGLVVGGKFLPGGQRANQYVSISPLIACTPNASLTTIPFLQYCLTIPDDGSQSSLGLVQAQYPGDNITRTDREGIFSTYCFVEASGSTAPADYVQAAGTVIPNCSTCPSSGTFNPALSVFEATFSGTASGTQTTAINTATSAYSGVATLLQKDPLTGVSTYSITATLGTTQAQIATALTGGTYTNAAYLSSSFVGDSAPSCTLSGSTYAWNSPTDFCNAVQVQFTISVADDACDGTGADILAELQAAYALIATSYGAVAGAVTLTTTGTCVNVFTLTTYSNNCVPVGCAPEQVIFPIIPDWNGEAWTPVALAQGTAPCVCGIQFQSDFTPRLERECTFGFFVRQYDWVHIEVSSHNPDWRSTDLCQVDPIATRIQNGAYPNGDGSAVVRIEKADRMYDMDYWYLEPNLREAFDFYFEAKFDLYYDMVGIEFEYEYDSNEFFGRFDHDRYIQYFWLPTTQAGNLITALNTYAASAAVNVEPIVL